MGGVDRQVYTSADGEFETLMSAYGMEASYTNVFLIGECSHPASMEHGDEPDWVTLASAPFPKVGREFRWMVIRWSIEGEAQQLLWASEFEEAWEIFEREQYDSPWE